MRSSGLKGRYKRKLRVTTVANGAHRMAAIVLNRDFKPAARDRAWCADITYIWTLEGWPYLAVLNQMFFEQHRSFGQMDSLLRMRRCWSTFKIWYDVKPAARWSEVSRGNAFCGWASFGFS